MVFNTSFFSLILCAAFAVGVIQASVIPSNEACPTGDGISSMNAATRDFVLKAFNGKRSDIAKGQFRMASGSMAPEAINMKKLVYNCTIEAAIQKSADTCGNNDLPDTYSLTLVLDNALLTINESITQATRQFFNFNANTAFGEALLVAGHAAFAYDDAISVACAYSRATCFGPDIKANIVCAVTPVRPSILPLYRTGRACYKDAQCTKNGYNKCDGALGLCFANDIEVKALIVLLKYLKK